MAEDGRLPGDPGAWRAEADRIRDRVESEHYRDGAYIAVAGEEGLDAAVLLGVLFGYPAADEDRWHSTLERIDAELGAGPLVFRTTELKDKEATFLPCAFWRAHALTRLGRHDEAREALDALVGMATDLGLYAEEAWPPDGRAQGNFPQALTHAAFVNAAYTFHQHTSEAS
jgi:GH15 family glucan-1,4-alpha-glucosidase